LSNSAQTIAITGATGFLGSHLLRYLVNQNYRVIVLKRSTSKLTRVADLMGRVKKSYDMDKISVREIFSNNKIDAVLHCATHYGRGDVPPQHLIEANLTLPLSILHWGSQSGVKAFLNTDTILDKRVSAYSLSKKQFLEWLNVYSSRMTCSTVALEHFFGPGDDRTKFVTFLVQSLLQATPKIDLTPGLQKRDFIFVDDIVSAFALILEYSLKQQAGLFSFEVGSGQTISIRDFVTLVKKMTSNSSTELAFGALPYRENEVMESHVNISKLVALGWRPKTRLEDGLSATIAEEKKAL
jgi:nucleoside-diphosphate-sugar epimerase